MDPLAGKYPFWTPYAFSGNRVIDAYEPEGKESVVDGNGKLTSYVVKPGQGPTQIAKDSNNPQTIKEHGYILCSKVTWQDVVASNWDEFRQKANLINPDDVNEQGYKTMNINPGDKLSLYGYSCDLSGPTEVTRVQRTEIGLTVIGGDGGGSIPGLAAGGSFYSSYGENGIIPKDANVWEGGLRIRYYSMGLSGAATPPCQIQ